MLCFVLVHFHFKDLSPEVFPRLQVTIFIHFVDYVLLFIMNDFEWSIFICLMFVKCLFPYWLCFSSGPNQWRDCMTPKQILANWCESQCITKPQYVGNTQLVLNNRIYTLSEFGKSYWFLPRYRKLITQTESIYQKKTFSNSSDLFVAKNCTVKWVT